MTTKIISHSERWQGYGIYALYLTCFSCLLSSSMIALFSTVMLICWLASGTFKNIPGIIKENSITVFGIIFCCLLLIGVSYSPAPLIDSVGFLKKYRLLLFIPIVLSLTKGHVNVPRNVVNAFLLGYLVVLVNAYLVHFHLLEPNVMSVKRSGGGFLVIFAYLVLQRALQEKTRRVLWTGFFLVLCYDIFFILHTRTGWLISIGLALLFVVQHFPLKKQGIALALTVCLGVGVFYTSQSIQQRVQLTINNLKAYHPEEKNSRTSIGLRLDWYQDSIDLIKEKPLFGYGTGSYATVQKKLIAGTATEAASDPHNEFLLTAVQIGLVGCVFLLLFFLDPVIRSFRLLRLQEREQAFALQATVLSLVIGCFFNSWLLSMIPSHIFVLLITVFYPVRTRHEQIDAS
ncbi:O-antigen ligase [Desulfopila sp. IMCC35006]|uniref:O-antigen ligase family protein n=1 Tax=Desulfopila sp. IMCC35006 TaxID=2569542 RepID=UPI00142EA264|nr:O-antigen ligase family protein [Desulfopila sp. IMCC35006]